MTAPVTLSRALAEHILNILLRVSVGDCDERAEKAAGELAQRLFAAMYPIDGEEPKS